MVDVNNPVKNPELLAAYNLLIKEPTEENDGIFVQHLTKAHFLMVLEGEMNHDPPDQGGRVTLAQDTIIRFPMLSDANGYPLHIAFTDWDALFMWRNLPDQQTLIVPFEELPQMVLREGSQCAGIVINPNSTNIYLRREHLAQISGLANKYSVEKNTEVLIGEPAEYPHELAAALIKHFSMTKEINKAWLMLMSKGGEQSFLIVIDCSRDTDKVLHESGAAAVPHLGQGQFVDIVSANDDFGRNAIHNRKPFYKKRLFKG